MGWPRWAALTVVLVVLGVWLAVGWLGLTSRQLLLLAHSGSGILVVHAGAGGLALLLPRTPDRARRWLAQASTVTLAAGAWLAVGLGTWAGYPAYLAHPSAAGSLTAAPRAWLRTQPELVWWDLLMTYKVLLGWLSPFVLTAVAVAVLRHGGLLAKDAATRRLVGVLLALGVGAAALAGAIGVGINIVTPNDFLRR